jgi:hypothetical protein
MKRIFIAIVIGLAIYVLSPVTSRAQTITTFEAKILDYQLPYPGLLPDNPLYFVKDMRDSFLLFVAQDDLDRARVHLLLSDKSLAAAEPLAKKGKHQMSVEMVQKSQESFAKIPAIVTNAKDKNGKALTSDQKKEFLDQLRKANLKHRETIEDLMKEMPQGGVEQLQALLSKNVENGKAIEALQ